MPKRIFNDYEIIQIIKDIDSDVRPKQYFSECEYANPIGDLSEIEGSKFGLRTSAFFFGNFICLDTLNKNGNRTYRVLKVKGATEIDDEQMEAMMDHNQILGLLGPAQDHPKEFLEMADYFFVTGKLWKLWEYVRFISIIAIIAGLIYAGYKFIF